MKKSEALKIIEELMAQVKDKDYLIQQQADEIERLRRDVCEIAGHGVWIEQESGLTYYKNCACSICGHTRVFKPDEVPKFCEECGSKMAPVIVERKERT